MGILKLVLHWAREISACYGQWPLYVTQSRGQHCLTVSVAEASRTTDSRTLESIKNQEKRKAQGITEQFGRIV